MSTFKMTFNPLASSKAFTQRYVVEAETLVNAEFIAESKFDSSEWTRNQYRQKLQGVEIEQEVSEQAQEVAQVEAQQCEQVEPQQAPEVDPFAQFETTEPDWSVASLNARLEVLKVGEKLVIDGLSDVVYHTADGISSSQLKLFIECPLKFKDRYINQVAQPEKKCFEFGRMVHTLFLEPWRFEAEYIGMPDDIKARRGKAWEAFETETKGKGQTVVSRADWAEVAALKDALATNSMARALISGGVAERSIFKRDEITGLVIKCRPDFYREGLITDLKTTKSSEPNAFKFQAKKLGYHIQDAFYSDIAEVEEFTFLVVESARPYVVTAPVTFDADLKELGRIQYKKALAELKQALNSGIWKGYTDEPVIMSATNYELEQLERLTETNLEEAA